ncbi:hypothetical protein ACKU3Z_029520 [Pseudomonas aeruginosa]|nr:hypothetical protein [Pseudomonas aeruginosa]
MSFNTSFILFPNGKVWMIDDQKTFSGTIQIPDYEKLEDLESLHNAINDSIAGSFVGLTSFTYSNLGNNLVSFTAVADELPDDPQDWPEEGCEHLTSDSPALREAIKQQYALTDEEVEHALESLGKEYVNERTTQLLGSFRQIRTPASPHECDYVRVLVDELEVARWSFVEWAKEPVKVMAAIFGSMQGSNI